jgi:hypothetical protein
VRGTLLGLPCGVGAFLARGGAEFRTPASSAVIAATAVAGLALLSKAASAAASADPAASS